MSKRKNLLLLSLAAVFSAAVLVGCGETVDPTPGPVEETGYTLTVSKDSNVSEVVISDANGALSDLTGIEEGTRLSATVTCVTDYEVSTVVFDGVSISATNGVYNFVMPGKDATLAVTSVKSTVYSAITVEADDGVASFSITDRGMEVSDLTNVAEGTELVISATPAAHFDITEVTLNGTALEANTNGTWSFTMPAASVEVGIASEQVEYAVNYSIPLDYMNYYIGEVTAADEDGNTIRSGDYVEVGSTVTLSIPTKSGGYTNYTWSGENGGSYSNLYVGGLYIYDNGTVSHPAASDIDETNASVVHYSFVVGEEDTDIYLNYNNVYSKDNGGINVNLVFPESGLTAINYSASDCYYSSFSFILLREEGFMIEKLTYTSPEGNETDLSSKISSLISFDGLFGTINWNSYYSGMNFEDGGKLTFEGSKHEVRNISFVGAENIEGLDDVTTRLVAGETFSLNGVTAKDGYSIADIEVTGLADDAEDPVEHSYSGWNVYFTMPDNDVTITFTVIENGTVTITAGKHIKSYHLRDTASFRASGTDVTSGEPGASLYLFAEAEEGYILPATVAVTVGETTTDAEQQEGYNYDTYETAYYYEIVMPEDGSDVSVTIPDAVEPVTASAGINSAGSIQFDANYSSTCDFAPGQNVAFTIRLNSPLNYLTSVFIEEDEDIEVTWSQRGNTTIYACSFTMPETDVTINYTVGTYPTTNRALSITSSIQGVEVYNMYSSISVNNADSNVSISLRGTSSDTLSQNIAVRDDTVTQISIAPKPGYIPVVSYTTADGSTPVQSSNTSSYYYNITCTSAVTGISISFIADTPVSYTVTKDSSVTGDVAYTCSVDKVAVGSDVTDFGDVYKGSYVDLKVTTEAPEGYAYIVTFTDSDGDALSYSSYYGGYNIQGDFKVTISLSQEYTLSIVNNTNGSISSSNVGIKYGAYNTYYAYNLPVTVFGGVSVYPYISYYGTAPYSYTFKIGETVVKEGSGLTSSVNSYDTSEFFAVTGDVVLTIWMD